MPYTKQRNPTGNTSEYRDRSRMYDLPAKTDKIGIVERKREGGRERENWSEAFKTENAFPSRGKETVSFIS